MNLEKLNRIYFIGIGGIGMSALARYFHLREVEVYGYDRTQTSLTSALEREGMTIHYEEDLTAIPDGIDLVVYTPAIPQSHQELTHFRDNGFKVLKRSQVLGLISQGMRTVAIAGTHGKTTTSSILTHLLRTCGFDCTAFLGGIALDYDSNYVNGNSNWAVAEADEFDRSFLHLTPEIAVILSMDPDHLDIYGDGDAVHDGFKAFAKKVKPGGRIIVKEGLPLNESDFPELQFDRYGIEGGAYRAENIRVENEWFYFDYKDPSGCIDNIQFSQAGTHNIENATAAIAVVRNLGASGQDIRTALRSFKGIRRRFEFILRGERVFIDDYAHHPSELKAAIHAARMLYPDKKLTGIFQPHLYSRTRDFADGFAEELDKIDVPILLEIYPARELPIEGVNAQMILDRMSNPNRLLLNKGEVIDELRSLCPELTMTLGAGDIDTLVKPIKEVLQ